MTDDLLKRAKRQRARAAESAAAMDADWYVEEERKIDSLGLTEAERQKAKANLMGDLVRRHKRSEGRAKRDNTPAKLLERDIKLKGSSHGR
ncbi:hypothetical protein E3O19_01420 [Cryobacterium algoritolerans]|uniref:Uncharacterized protein n=1 Tax=Cryobacterium algoritolerans TaxID=1259184 RepID=A0A4V3IFD9_9MICO|nr:hypothetical protein [Cryobacterium algoritolerans]TFC20058.1 hypothetical protein E3O19_01420 [Cryobacterium algoritolerans]